MIAPPVRRHLVPSASEQRLFLFEYDVFSSRLLVGIVDEKYLSLAGFDPNAVWETCLIEEIEGAEAIPSFACGR